jgi:hypothetical protein
VDAGGGAPDRVHGLERVWVYERIPRHREDVRVKAGPTPDDFLTVRNAFGDLLIRHDITAMSAPDIASARLIPDQER